MIDIDLQHISILIRMYLFYVCMYIYICRYVYVYLHMCNLPLRHQIWIKLEDTFPATSHGLQRWFHVDFSSLISEQHEWIKIEPAMGIEAKRN